MSRSFGYKAIEIAQFFINATDRSVGDSITHLKVQKLVYYAQGWSLALLGRPLFSEDLQAWTHGPVAESVWKQYNKHSWNALPPEESNIAIKKPEVLKLLGEVFAVYGNETAKQLEHRTHNEPPWLSARGDVAPGEKGQHIISTQEMQDYFRSLAKAA